MRRLKVLVVDEEVPFPQNTGKKIRTFNLLKELSQRHAITFVCFGEEDESLPLRNCGIQCKVVKPLTTLGRPRFFADIAASLGTPYPYSVVKHYKKRLQVALDKELESPYDLVHFEWTPYARYRVNGRKSVIGTHNIETDIWSRRAAFSGSAIGRVFFSEQARRMGRFEQQVFRRADMVTTVTEDDQKRAEAWGAKRTKVVPNSVDPDYFRIGRNPEPNRLLFLGSLDWFPNEDAVRYLLNEVLPLVRGTFNLDIVGRNPSTSLQALIAATEHVTLHANVPDVRPFLSRSGAMIVPLRIGGGSRIKILEAMAAQLPVISTAVGAEGLGFRAGREIVLADNPQQIADAIEHAMAFPSQMRDLAAAGHQHVISKYTWRQSAQELEQAWFEVAAE